MELIKEAKRLQKLAGILKENEEEGDVEKDFENAPESHSYDEVEEIFKITGPEQLIAFQKYFKGKKQISKKEYVNFVDNILNPEGDDWFFDRGNWINLSDPDWYSRN